MPVSQDPQIRRLVRLTRDFKKRVSELQFSEPVRYVYNPLDYAREPHEAYLRKFGGGEKRAILLGMNPGPFGMAQTGVPFGDIPSVRDWLGISHPVKGPREQHPKRPILGFDCPKREVSGSRFWGWAKERYGQAPQFFETFFVVNYCPLAFLEPSGRNLTPDKLPAQERLLLTKTCDAALEKTVKLLQPEWVVGIGAYATKRAASVLEGTGVKIGTVLHPSPASPRANRGWAEQAEGELSRLELL